MIFIHETLQCSPLSVFVDVCTHKLLQRKINKVSFIFAHIIKDVHT